MYCLFTESSSQIVPRQPKLRESGYVAIEDIPGLVVPPGRNALYDGEIIGRFRDGDVRAFLLYGQYIFLIPPYNDIKYVDQLAFVLAAGKFMVEERLRRQVLRNAVAAVHAGVQGVVYRPPMIQPAVYNENINSHTRVSTPRPDSRLFQSGTPTSRRNNRTKK